MTELRISRIAEPDDAGQRLDKWLASWAELSRSRIKALIEAGDVYVNDKVTQNISAKIISDNTYTIQLPPPVDDTPQAENIPLGILHEDEHLIVVNKPAGMTVHPAPGSRTGTLVNALLYHCKDTLSGIGGVLRPGIVHRIDKDTSGLLVVAKNDKAHQKLSKQFADHSIHRVYSCFVRGCPKPRSGTVESRLARSPHNRKKQAVVKGTWGNIYASEQGRHAVTHYAYKGGYSQQPGQSVGTPLVSRIECRLETGRTHQIRVHMAHLGCPLLGDPLYGKQRAYDTTRNASLITINDFMKTFKRQALHAAELGFIHPMSKEEMVFKSDLPNDIQNLMSVLNDLNTNA